MERCRHCFEELEGWEHLCQTCRKKKKLPIPRAYVFDPASPAALLNKEAVEALAGFAFCQWVQLEWPTPDVIIPMPGALSVASVFASLLERPLAQALSSSCEYREGRLEDTQILLLFDVQSSLQDQEKAALSLMQAFPKRSYLLTLFPYVDDFA